MDDEDEIDRLLGEFGMALPAVEEDDNEIPVSFNELDDSDLERKPRDWRAEWERDDWEDDE